MTDLRTWEKLISLPETSFQPPNHITPAISASSTPLTQVNHLTARRAAPQITNRSQLFCLLAIGQVAFALQVGQK